MPSGLRQLRRVMPPPEQSAYAQGDWKQAEEKLGTALPPDYKRFIETYGTGEICELMFVWNPFAPSMNLIRAARQALKVYDFFPPEGWDLFPHPDGLLPWSASINDDVFFWRTKGPPSRWDIVIYDYGDDCYRLVEGRSFSEVLLAMLTDELDEFHIPEELIGKEPKFVAWQQTDAR